MSVLGNDFVVIDVRGYCFEFDVVKIAHRKLGIGCDQVLLIESSLKADCKMIVFNADGTPAETCGNGACAVASLMFDLLKHDFVTIESHKVIINAWKLDDKQVRIMLGKPSIYWADIPLTRECNTLSLPLNALDSDSFAVAVNVGNPHVVFFYGDIRKVSIKDVWFYAVNSGLFVGGINVSIAQVNGNCLTMRVWERGVGETEACGTAASAAVYAAFKKGIFNSSSAFVYFQYGIVKVEVEMDKIFLTAPVELIFSSSLKTLFVLNGVL